MKTATAKAATDHAPIAAADSPLDLAMRALLRGCAFLSSSAPAPVRAISAIAIPLEVERRLLRNRLRELDRLTAILIDEMAIATHPAADAARVRAKGSVVAKIATLRALRGIANPDKAELQRMMGLTKMSASRS